MRKLLAVAAVALVAACGGGVSEKPAKRAGSSQSPAGGVVTAEPTKGVLPPAVSVLDGKEATVGRTRPLSPDESRPTDAQQNGVGGARRCVRTSANPSPANLGRLSGAILCLLNSERAAK